MESLHDYKMLGNHSLVEQAHETQCIANELELLERVIPNKFVTECIIVKLPPWRGFTTTIKHKRQKIIPENFIASLDIEENTRAKYTSDKGGKCHPSANMVQKNPYGKNKMKNKSVDAKTTTAFKKKNTTELPYFTYGQLGHFFKECHDRAQRKGKNNKSINVVTPSKAVKEINLAPLKLINSYLCEMNGVLTYKRCKQIFHDFD